MRTPRTLDTAVADLLALLGLLVARTRNGAPVAQDPEACARAEHDLEVAVEAVRRLVARLEPGLSAAPERPRTVSLTMRERLIADMLCEGKSYKDIANALTLTVLSVQSRVKQIYMKLAVHSKAELRSALIRLEVRPPGVEAPVDAAVEESS